MNERMGKQPKIAEVALIRKVPNGGTGGGAAGGVRVIKYLFETGQYKVSYKRMNHKFMGFHSFTIFKRILRPINIERAFQK